jgi:hypothetical protein
MRKPLCKCGCEHRMHHKNGTGMCYIAIHRCKKYEPRVPEKETAEYRRANEHTTSVR